MVEMANPYEDRVELVYKTGNNTRVWRVSRRCHQCGERWVWYRYSNHRRQTGYDRCAECAYHDWTAQVELRARIMSTAMPGRFNH